MTSRHLAGLAATFAILASISGCARDLTDLELARFPSDPEIFIDGFAPGVTFQAFAGSKADAVEVDQSVFYRGSSALRIDVPLPADPGGSYAGGAFTATTPRDLTAYNALTFWARASRAASLDVAGLGNDNTGTSLYTAQTSGLPLTTDWQQYAIPIPQASPLDREAGLFFFAEGAENGQSYTIWVDELQFANLNTITDPRPVLPPRSLSGEVGETATLTGTTVTYTVSGQDITVSAAPAYFDFASSDPSVATVDDRGVITFVGPGSAQITASLGSVAAQGTVSVFGVAPPDGPAPTPTVDETDGRVISLFSDAYTDIPVDTWSADFDQADVEDVLIDGNAVKKYTNLVFAGVEFISSQVDATDRTNFSMDVWLDDASDLRIKLVDFGADGAFGGGDDVEHEIALSETSTPPLALNQWNTLDLPLSEFAGLTTRAHLSQLIISGASSTLYLDNVFFYDAGGGGSATEPSEPAPAPTYDPGSVISLFSDAYTDVAVDTWLTVWSDAALEDVSIEGNATKKYTSLNFAGVEMVASPVDVSAMTHFRMDVWTPDPTAEPAAFRVKLVDFGADGAFGGGDDAEHEVTLTAASTPAIGTGSWFTLEMPLSDFTGLVTRQHIAQLIISGDPNTVFVDNVLFFDEGGSVPTEPATPAPTPTADPADVISLFSDAYTDVPVDTWRTDWSDASFEDVTVAGNPTKKYTELVFVGIETVANPVDITSMTRFHMDLWTPDDTSDPAAFRIKLVDFGADGAFGGGDDVEHEITLTAATTPALATGTWLGLDIPLSEFAGLVTREHIAQLILSGDPNTVFVDNVYFRK